MTIRPSRLLLLILAVMHGLAIGAVSLTALTVVLKGALVAALIFSMAWQGWLYRNFDAGLKIRTVRVDSKHSLWLDGLGEESQQAELNDAWLGPGFGVTIVNSKGRLYRLVWMPDSAEREALRRWRVWLRWKSS